MHLTEQLLIAVAQAWEFVSSLMWLSACVDITSTLLCFICSVFSQPPRWYASFDPERSSVLKIVSKCQHSFSSALQKRTTLTSSRAQKTRPSSSFNRDDSLHCATKPENFIPSRSYKSHAAMALMDIRPPSRNVRHKQISGLEVGVGVQGGQLSVWCREECRCVDWW